MSGDRPHVESMTGHEESMSSLIEEIYEAALGARGWGGVMAMMKERFRSSAETFYFLDFEARRSRPVHLGGITDDWYASFAMKYFTKDNPWITHTGALHQPRVIRTNERLAAYTQDPEILYRSQYYNEWMRPQGLKYTIGNTLRTDSGTIVNMTLLRDADARTFQPAEVAAFEQLSRHLERALRVGVQLESATVERDRFAAIFEQSAHGLVILDMRGKVLHFNPAARRLLEHRDGLALSHNRLQAINADDQRQLDSLLRPFLRGHAVTAIGAPAGIVIRRPATGPLLVNVAPLPQRRQLLLGSGPAILMTMTDPAAARMPKGQALSLRYALTAAEWRLAQRLIQGESLREIAAADGLSYETLRGYLKALFQKTGTNRQAQLVAHLMRESASL